MIDYIGSYHAATGARKGNQVRFFFVVLMLLSGVGSFGQHAGMKVVEVHESYSIELTPTSTMLSVERAAVEQARLKAIGQHCGFTLKEVTMNRVLESRKQSNTGSTSEYSEDFSVYTNSSVLGVWVRDLTEPQIEWHCVNTNAGQRLEVTAKVHGEVRGLPDKGLAEVTFYACNPNTPNEPKTEYKNNDWVGAIFQTAQSGYAEIFYLSVGDDRAFRLLPGKGRSENMAPVLADTLYRCFMSGVKQPSPVWNTSGFQVTLGTEQDQVFDELVFIYSPKEFTKPLLGKDAEMTINAFIDWLGNSRIQNEEMVVKQVVLDIRKK